MNTNKTQIIGNKIWIGRPLLVGSETIGKQEVNMNSSGFICAHWRLFADVFIAAGISPESAA